MITNRIALVECPRDAMQGWKSFIPTDKKVAYLNQLLKVGFDVLDFGSFVSPKAIPQLADTHEVVKQLDLSATQTQLLAIVANLRGAEEAMQYNTIKYVGFPFSISETFQLRNTNKTIQASLGEVEKMQALCVAHDKELVLYISMAFGNPYGDNYNAALAIDWFKKIADLGIKTIAMADTVGVANPENIAYIFEHLSDNFPNLNIGAHFHSTITTRNEKLDAAWDNGCRRYDSALLGIGGCPMANDDLVGNMATESLLQWAKKRNIIANINQEELTKSMIMASEIFAH